MKTIALLPMKAHSERVPNKNIKLFGGKPLYHWALLALVEVPQIDEILINTDSEVIAQEAPILSEKVRVLRRPEELCGDFVSMNRIIEYDLAHSDGEVYLQTHSTNPLISSATYGAALKSFSALEGYDSLFSVNRFQSRFYSDDGSPLNHDPARLLRTQDLPPLFEENSCLYLFSNASFAASKARIGRRPFMFATPRMESVDIDDEETWQLAACMAGTRG